MKLQKLTIAIATLTIMLTACFATAQSDARKTFDQLKGLEGKWVGKNSQGQTLEVTFRSTAGGSALMSEIRWPRPRKHDLDVPHGRRPALDDALLRRRKPAAHESHCVGREVREL